MHSRFIQKQIPNFLSIWISNRGSLNKIICLNWFNKVWNNVLYGWNDRFSFFISEFQIGIWYSYWLIRVYVQMSCLWCWNVERITIEFLFIRNGTASRLIYVKKKYKCAWMWLLKQNKVFHTFDENLILAWINNILHQVDIQLWTLHSYLKWPPNSMLKFWIRLYKQQNGIVEAIFTCEMRYFPIPYWRKQFH